MPRFTVTPWRDPSELKKMRAQLYQLGEFKTNDRRQDAVNQINAWRARKSDFPLALDSTCVLVAATVQDEAGELPTISIRMQYALAISRFVTGFCDTTQNTNFKQAMHERAAELKLPNSLVEIRHEVTHRDLPSLIRLRESAKKSLDWLWTWYWMELETTFNDLPAKISGQKNVDVTRECLESTLNKYVTARRDEVKNKTSGTLGAATAACMKIVRLCNGKSESLELLAELLVVPRAKAKCLIPSDKQLGSSMSGAYTIWDKLLRQLNNRQPGFLSILLTRMIDVLIEPSTYALSREPIKEALYEWVIHILQHYSWALLLKASRITLTEEVLTQCLVSVTQWTIKLAEALTKDQKLFQKDWEPLVQIALGTYEATIQKEDPEDLPARTGWVKRRGLWPRTAIGTLPRETDYQNRVALRKLQQEAGYQTED